MTLNPKQPQEIIESVRSEILVSKGNKIWQDYVNALRLIAQVVFTRRWLNLVERWFGEITRKRIRRGVFHSVPELVTAIEEYISCNNASPKPFVWTKRAEDIINKVSHCKAVLET
jgi:hypothetical protein